MADADLDPGGPTACDERLARLGGDGHRLLQQDVHPGVDDLLGGLGVQVGGEQYVDGVELALGEHCAERGVNAGDAVPRRERTRTALVPVADCGQSGTPDRPQGCGVPVGDVAGPQESRRRAVDHRISS